MSAYLRLQPDCTHVCPLCHTKPGTCPVLLRVDAPATSHTGATHETGLRVLDFRVDSASWGTPLPIPLSTLEGRAQPWVWRLATVPSDGGDTGSLHGGGGSPGPEAPFPSFSGPSVPAQIVWESPDVWTLRSRSRQVAEQSRLSGLSPERHPTSNSHAAPDADARAALPWRRRRTPSPPALRAPARLSAPAEGAHARRSISCFTSKMSCVATTLNRREVTVCQHVGLWLIIVFL